MDVVYPKVGAVVTISINGKPSEGVVGGYNYGMSGDETSFYFEDTPQQRYPIEFMLDDRFVIQSEPMEDEEELNL